MKHSEQIDVRKRPPIVLTARDRESLTALLRDSASALDPEIVRSLQGELERADIAPEVASSMMVSLGCEVKFIDHNEQRVRTCRLVADQMESRRSISVLSPIGSALIGLGPGQSIAWAHREREYQLTVLEIRPSR
jgi:regulator of nucleoside diphosphate kinase